MRKIKRLLKGSLQARAPQLLFAYRAMRRRRQLKRTFLPRQKRVKALLYGDATPRILSGPFAGLRYIDEVVWGPIEPKWFGTYERELDGVVARILAKRYDAIVDIGSAEGYYSVSLASKFPDAQIFSYDVDPWARAQQQRLADLNGVANLTISGFCTPEELEMRLASRSLLVCDIEGFEYGLLDTAAVPGLGKADILVELHMNQSAGLDYCSGSALLQDRFRATHDITEFAAVPRGLDDLDHADVKRTLSGPEIVECMDEKRSPRQLWLWLEAKRSN